MFVTSGYTSTIGTGAPSASGLELCAGDSVSGAAEAAAQFAAAHNLVSGQAGSLQVTCRLDTTGNPRITATVQRTGLPTFFARIWGRSASSVSATATAEAYNASQNDTQIQLVGVKPWLIPNCDPNNSTPPNSNCVGGAGVFVNADGSIPHNLVGKPITLQRLSQSPGADNIPAANRFYALDVPTTPSPLCPAASGPPCSNLTNGTAAQSAYRENIACSSQIKFSCGQDIGPGTDPLIVPNITTGGSSDLFAVTRDGVRCLIHAQDYGFNQGQDIFIPNGTGPVQINGGDNNPNMFLQTANISRSDSVITAPIYDGRQYTTANQFCIYPSGACTTTTKIIGFLQIGITDAESGIPQANGYILNVVGCGANSGAGGVSSNGTSPIPVRLIQ